MDAEAARARFRALISPKVAGAPLSKEPSGPLPERTITEEDMDVERAPWERPRLPAAGAEEWPPSVIERVGLLPLAVDAAIQQEIWRGESKLQEILARHAIDELTWRDHLLKREEALRDEAEKGAADRARAERLALDRARRPPEAPREPSLDLETYAALRALIDDSADNEAAVLAARGVPKDVWDREHRAYRKRLRAEPALAERFRGALEEHRKAPQAPAPLPAAKKKTISRKFKHGAHAAGPPASSSAPQEENLGAARRPPA